MDIRRYRMISEIKVLAAKFKSNVSDSLIHWAKFIGPSGTVDRIICDSSNHHVPSRHARSDQLDGPDSKCHPIRRPVPRKTTHLVAFWTTDGAGVLTGGVTALSL